MGDQTESGSLKSVARVLPERNQTSAISANLIHLILFVPQLLALMETFYYNQNISTHLIPILTNTYYVCF